MDVETLERSYENASFWWIRLIQDYREADLIYRKKNAEMVEIDSTYEKGLLEEMK